MKMSVRILLFFCMIFILSINSFSQKRDSLIQLYPGLGDTLDLFNRNYFELFQNIEGFEYALFYIRDNKHLVSKVTFTKEGLSRDTVFIQTLSALQSSKTRIEQIEKESNKKIDSSEEFIIVTKNGNQYECKLEMFSKNSLYLVSEKNNSTFNSTELKFKLPLSSVDNLILPGESNTLSCIGEGALITTGAGLMMVLFAGGEGAAILFLPIVAAFGAIVGLVAGLISSSDDEIFQIDYQDDILKLKDYAKYYFRYEDSLEQRYIEIE